VNSYRNLINGNLCFAKMDMLHVNFFSWINFVYCVETKHRYYNKSMEVVYLIGVFFNCRYKLGFCPNGPDCRYRHAKMPGPPPPIEEVLQKIQHLNSYNYNPSNKFYQQRNANFSQQAEKSQFPQGPNTVNQGVVGRSSTNESANVQQQQQSQQQVSQNQIQNLPNGLPNQTNRTSTPLPQGISRCVQRSEVFN
jgi:hypothetical protein